MTQKEGTTWNDQKKKKVSSYYKEDTHGGNNVDKIDKGTPRRKKEEEWALV
jgi:hypothetical protein